MFFDDDNSPPPQPAALTPTRVYWDISVWLRDFEDPFELSTEKWDGEYNSARPNDQGVMTLRDVDGDWHHFKWSEVVCIQTERIEEDQ